MISVLFVCFCCSDVSSGVLCHTKTKTKTKQTPTVKLVSLFIDDVWISESWLEKPFPLQGYKNFVHSCSSTFIVLLLMFKLLIHLDFFLVYSNRNGSLFPPDA